MNVKNAKSFIIGTSVRNAINGMSIRNIIKCMDAINAIDNETV
ncbi:hypothetical protein C672_3314 [[Clostridium] bifermentans ATCC 638]|uniref:Uncharacterized protein n=1 Tax=Paraclostridium bifermentans ATCC 638 = DSM 14991 TaxID=1233171 RepID=T4VHC1_PARBF|nr:hypothetical protein C672_3314 [[Clostridium] bifermentans ATCC 638] [Paraclostridium bifermentans ATCC 638 = DSM 14991]